VIRGTKQTKALLLVALVAALSGCGKAKSTLTAPKATYGQASCDYDAKAKGKNLGNFDVQIVLTRTPKTYALYITPVALATVGDIVTITIVGPGNVFKELIQQLRPVVGKMIPTALLTEEDLLTYTTLVIAQYQPGVSPLESTAARLNICPLVQPGDSLTQ
jgi:hypothetical protein